MLTIRPAGASRRSGSIACVTAITPNTFVSKTPRMLSSGEVLGMFVFMRSSNEVPGGTALVLDALGCTGDRRRIRDVKLDGVGIPSNAGCRRLSIREVARPD